VIDLNKNADPEKVLSTLYKRTAMHSTFNINLLALVDGSPHRLTLKQSLRVFAEHRLEVVAGAASLNCGKMKNACTFWRRYALRLRILI